MRRAWVLVPLVLAAFAGCAEPKADAGSELQRSLEDYEVEVTPTTGALRGVVVDDKIRPIAGASVHLPTTGVRTSTTDNGLFGFEGIAPGVYFLNVTAPGYFPVQQSAEVAAGEVVDLRVLLAPDLRVQPYHGDTMKFDGFFEVGSGFADEIITLLIGNDTPLCRCVFGFQSEGPIATLVVELTYENSIPNPSPTFWTLDVGDDPDTGNPLYFCYPNPCVAHFPAANFTEGNTNFTVKVWSDPVWFHFQQDFQVFTTIFYVAEAPKGWSFLAGDP